jgi:valyl-tRNA synthetase
VPFTEVFCHSLIRDSEDRKIPNPPGNVTDPLDIVEYISFNVLSQKLISGNSAQSEVQNTEKCQMKAFPQGIPGVRVDASGFSLVNYA